MTELPEPKRIQTHGYNTVAAYTTAQLQEYGEAMRREALEEAAKVCETEAWRLKSIAVSQQSAATNSKSIGLSVAADKIRGLK